MTYSQVYPNFNVWYDTDGTPLEDGTLYVGTAGLDPESNPITIYYDTSLAVAAQQPLSIMNGYIVNNGSPANIYIPPTVNSFSLRTKNSANVTLFNNLNTPALGINFGYPTAPTGKSYFNGSSPSNEQDYMYQNPASTLYQLFANGSLGGISIDQVLANSGTFQSAVTVGGVSVRSASILNSGVIDSARLPTTATQNVNNSSTNTDNLTVNTSSDLNGPISSNQGQVASMWVNFSGVGGTTIKASYNVSGVTRNGVGDYTINIDDNMPTENYAISLCAHNEGVGGVDLSYVTGKAVGSIDIQTTQFDGNAFISTDMSDISVVIFHKQ